MWISYIIISILSIISGIMVISSINPVHSVFWLVVTFINSAALFVLLELDFMALMLIIIYVGAIAILFLFAHTYNELYGKIYFWIMFIFWNLGMVYAMLSIGVRILSIIIQIWGGADLIYAAGHVGFCPPEAASGLPTSGFYDYVSPTTKAPSLMDGPSASPPCLMNDMSGSSSSSYTTVGSSGSTSQATDQQQTQATATQTTPLSLSPTQVTADMSGATPTPQVIIKQEGATGVTNTINIINNNNAGGNANLVANGNPPAGENEDCAASIRNLCCSSCGRCGGEVCAEGCAGGGCSIL